jgi:hypothetical protein
VVEPADRIPLIKSPSSIDFENDALSLRQDLSNGIVNEIPFNVTRTLQKHRLYTGETLLLPNRDEIFAGYVENIKKENAELAKACHWAYPTEKATYLFFNLMARQPERVNSSAFVTNIVRLCPRSKENLGPILLLVSRMIIADSKYQFREQISQLGIEFSEASHQ